MKIFVGTVVLILAYAFVIIQLITWRNIEDYFKHRKKEKHAKKRKVS